MNPSVKAAAVKRSRKGFLRLAVPAVAATAVVLSTSGIASASVAPTPVVADSACQALELTKIINGHDHMFLDPTVDNSPDCVYEIVDGNSLAEVFLTRSAAGNQPQPDGIYDGPGVSLRVRVLDEGVASADAYGPPN
ncbi:hypothetical protein [Streptomyces sp. HPF1205]|uniref:hypothetical protein n=1 Tax=Streptomyces sp. HPF1205 TaxID=2873262 RepID=UPI001CEC50CD|nr:hypothetical protein [Streptomyces sp. HPF1205]